MRKACKHFDVTFHESGALAKVQAAADAWNTRDPERVAAAHTVDTRWRNRSTFLTGRDKIVAFLTDTWAHEHDHALRKSLWAYSGTRIAVRFQYEWREDTGQWWRSHGNENWEFDAHGLMSRREASIDDVTIAEADRRILGPRQQAEHGQDLPLR